MFEASFTMLVNCPFFILQILVTQQQHLLEVFLKSQIFNCEERINFCLCTLSTVPVVLQ
jgi:hypothetical protein